MPTPTKTKRIDVKFLVWGVTLILRYYPTYAIADMPDTKEASDGGETLCYRKLKITGEDYARLCSLDDESEIADFFGLRVRC